MHNPLRRLRVPAPWRWHHRFLWLSGLLRCMSPLLAQSGHDPHLWANFYIEMMCGFHRAERMIERDGGAVLQVRLHEDRIGTLARGNFFQRIDCPGSNTLAPMSV